MSANDPVCESWDGGLPAYVDACLRESAVQTLFPALHDHLAHCPACALLVAEVIRMTRVREALDPYNGEILPLRVPVTPAGSYRHVG